MTNKEILIIKTSNVSSVEKMRQVYSCYTADGLSLLFELMIQKRIKLTEKALILAVGLAILNGKNPEKADAIMCKIKQSKQAEKLQVAMQLII